MKRTLLIFVAILVAVALLSTPVVAAGTATRVLPSSVDASTSFTVSITASDYGAFGQVVETLPDGFSYVSSTLSEAAVTVEGQVVKFTLLGDTSFTYDVTASSSADTYAFSGILKDEDLTEPFPTVGGDTQITVTLVPTATRDLPSSVATGASFTVSVTASDYGAFGQVVETLPSGFSYVSSTLSEAAVTVEGQMVKFTLLGDTSFSYTVTASSTAGTHTFSGILKDEDLTEPFPTVGGDTQIVVTTPTPPAPPPSGGGGGDGDGAYYPTPAAHFSAEPTSGIAPLEVQFTESASNEQAWSWDFGDGATSTAQNPSHTYTEAGVYTVTLTVTNPGGQDTEIKADYITVAPPLAPTPVPPLATPAPPAPTPAPAPAPTPAPTPPAPAPTPPAPAPAPAPTPPAPAPAPTPAPTPVLATTPTPLAPIMPTPAPTPVPTGGLAGGWWVLVGVAIVVLIGGGVYYVLRRRRAK
ncbi:hypothetical protein LCGC14_0699270 [marine sediment metagenome]|uniref:PKD domain-containing protein n=1 Tax=marine sediment metagenome TaxID=412755 RepID=A0A0F9QID8_9ZZZZ